jgi:hypothetical protein
MDKHAGIIIGSAALTVNASLPPLLNTVLTNISLTADSMHLIEILIQFNKDSSFILNYKLSISM